MAISYKGKNWVIGASRNCSFWQQCVFEGYAHTGKFGAPDCCESGVITVNGTRSSIFWDVDGYDKFEKELIQMSLSPKKIKEIERKYKEFAKSFIKSAKELNTKLTVTNLDKFFKENARYAGGLMITLAIGRAIYDELKKRLTDLGHQNTDEIIGHVSYPNAHTPLMKSRLELHNIANKKGDKDKELKKWLNKFQHIPVNYCEEPWNLDDAKKQLQEISSNKAKNLKSIHENHKDKIKKKKSSLKEIGNKEITNLSYALAQGTYLNEFRKGIFCKVSLTYRPAFQRIAEMAGSDSWRDCYYLTPEEMRDIVAGKKLDIKDIKSKRQLAGAIFDENGKLTLLTEDEIKLFTPKEILPQSSNGQTVTELKGTTANKGKVTGTVKVVADRSEFGKFKRGDVLVAKMTSVDYVPIMEMAAAFVTNEGGITSHASIVSREMNKPCIIGTKIATEIFKDGDVVEVDADHGTVRILKQS